MIAAILSQVGRTLATEGNLNNEIGTPLTLLSLRPEHQFGVIEIGMNHEGEIGRLTATAEPDVGVVTLAAAVHVENFGTIENVARAKGELYTGMRLDAVAVANADDALMTERAKWAGRQTLWFGRAANADVRLVKIVSHDARGVSAVVSVLGREYPMQLPVVGLHNAMNGCAALAVSLALGVPVETALKGLSTARPPGRRLRLTPIPGIDATLLDDCYNANPHSTIAAVDTLKELVPAPNRIAVLGDMRELGADEVSGHRSVGEAAARADVKLLVAFGTASREIAEGARLAGLDSSRILHTSDPSSAADRVRAVLTAHDLVLVKASRGTRLERVSDLLAPPALEESH
jgi:UDP-N-acetylmuramoyl-tripeptide--D-alanyl-D-alanine ligase